MRQAGGSSWAEPLLGARTRRGLVLTSLALAAALMLRATVPSSDPADDGS